MICSGDFVTVGLSGGADSVCLCHILKKLESTLNIKVCAVHINHGIRGEEALRDENFVISFCKKLQIPLSVFHFDIPDEAEKAGETIEECGRRIRYECFEKVRSNGKIATAHSLSDNIETVIFHIVRGCGLNGLCGIPAVRGNIIRPLIDCTREEIEKYCTDNNLTFVTDSSNLKDTYTRNKIRHNISSVFEEINPSYSVAFSRLINMVNDDNEYLYKKAEAVLSEYNDSIPTEVLLRLHKSISARVIKMFIETKSGIVPEYKQIELILLNLSNRFCIEISKGIFADICDGCLTIKTESKVSDGFSFELQDENTFSFGKILIKKVSVEKLKEIDYDWVIDLDKTKGKLLISNRLEGDKITLVGRNVTKSLKKLFIEMKIPKEQRNLLPVIRDEEKVIWVRNAGINKKVSLNSNTKNCLAIKYISIIGG